MMKQLIFWTAVIVLAGCAGSKVLDTRSAAGTDFTAYKTFNFYKIESNLNDTESTAYQTNIALLQSAIINEMQLRGYQLSIDKPALLLNVGIVVNEKAQTRETNYATDAPRYIGQRNYKWQSEEVTVGHYKEGTVTVDVVDNAKNTVIWQGTVADVIPKNASRLAKDVKEGIHKLYEKFPVQPK